MILSQRRIDPTGNPEPQLSHYVMERDGGAAICKARTLYLRGKEKFPRPLLQQSPLPSLVRLLPLMQECVWTAQAWQQRMGWCTFWLRDG